MENENLKPVEKLTPFTKMIMTIGTLPSSFYASMSYYESMVWLYEYLKNEVILAVNNNGEAVEELQAKYIELHDYVEHYFDNLDVQQEINIKLDEMATDGTLTELIKDYVDPIYQDYESSINDEISTFKNSVNGEISTFEGNINSDISRIETKVDSATSGSPLVASSTADMTETDRVYVNTTDGKWYYYDGDSWEIGGTYQSTSFESDFNALMENINLAEGKLYGNKIDAYAFDYRIKFEDEYTETLGLMNGYDLTTFLPIYSTTAESLAYGLINIDFELPSTGFITFKRATSGLFQFSLYKENDKNYAINVGSSAGGWDELIGFTLNDDGTVTLDCSKVTTQWRGGYTNCVAILDKNDRVMYSNDYQIELPIYLKNFTSPAILTIKKDGSGDYDNLRDATEYIISNPLTQGYELDIYPGTYDVFSDYTSEEINSALYDGTTDHFCGILIPDKVKLKGIGSKENIIIKGEIDNITYTEQVRTQISTLNLAGNCELENLTITSKYIRYPVHDDFAENENSSHIINNCRIESILATNGLVPGVSYGLGTKSGSYLEMNSCNIIPTLGYHNNASFTKAYDVVLNNCHISKNIAINDTNSSVHGYLTLNNTYSSYINYTLGAGLNEQYTEIRGNGVFNEPIISNYQNIKYHFNNIVEILTSNQIGQCLVRYTLTNYKQTSGKILSGIYVFNDNNIKYLQTSGYIPVSKLGTTNYSNWADDDYLKIGDDGYLTKTTNLDDAIAYVLTLNSVKYIKLL